MSGNTFANIVVVLFLAIPVLKAFVILLIALDPNKGQSGISLLPRSNPRSQGDIAVYHRLQSMLEKQRAEQKAVRAAERAKRRAEREAVLIAKGITPGPMAWFWDLSDLGQAIVMGLALAVPLGIVVVLVFCSISSVGKP